MSTVKELRKKSLHKYSLHIGYSWIISAFGCLIAGAIAFIFSYFTSFLIIPFGLLILPLLFSTICSHRALHFKKEPEAKRFLTYFRAFYSREFRSSFNFVSNCLKTLLCMLVTYVIASPIVYMSFKNSSSTFEASIQSMLTLINTLQFTTADINNILAANDYELIRYMMLVLTPTSVVEFFAMFFFASVSSFSIYNRFEADKLRMPFAIGLSKATIKNHRGEFYKYYFGLNWPMYVVIALFAAGACFLSYYLGDVTVMPYTLIIPICLGGMTFFYPFFLNNNETIHEEFENYYKETAKSMSDELLNTLKEQQVFNEEQREAIERALSQIKNDSENNEKPEIEKEKDPPNSES